MSEEVDFEHWRCLKHHLAWSERDSASRSEPYDTSPRRRAELRKLVAWNANANANADANANARGDRERE